MEETVKRVSRGAKAIAEAGAEGLTRTVDALIGAVTDEIVPATMQAVDEMKALFPDPNNRQRTARPI